MRVALIVPGFSASEEDWCIPAVLNFVRALAQRHDVDVFTLRYPHRRDTYRVYGATVHALGGARVDGMGRLPLLLRAAAGVVAHHARRRFDVVHGLWADEPGFLAVAVGRLVGVPAVVSLLGGELVGFGDIGYGTQLSAAGRRLVRIALAGARRVTVGSTYLARLAAPHVAGERLQLAPLGVDTALFRADRATPADPALAGAPRLLHVASLAPVKDQATLLHALARAVRHAPGLHLHLVGDGPLRGELERIAAALALERHVTFHGAVPHDRLPGYYRAAELCVLSSRYESQGMVVLEAAACERPTVGTAVGLLPDLVPDTETAAVGDAAALADIIVRLGRDPGARRAGGTEARRRVVARYALDRTVESMDALYRTVASR